MHPTQSPPAPLISHNHHIQVQKALSGTVSCTNRAYARDTSWDGGSCVLARLMHATGLCAIGGCRIQASTRDRLVHKSGLCTRHYGMFKAWKVPQKLVEVSCDVTQHLVAYRTAVGTRTYSSELRTHTGQHSRLPCMHTLIFT